MPELMKKQALATSMDNPAGTKERERKHARKPKKQRQGLPNKLTCTPGQKYRFACLASRELSELRCQMAMCHQLSGARTQGQHEHKNPGDALRRNNRLGEPQQGPDEQIVSDAVLWVALIHLKIHLCWQSRLGSIFSH